MSREHIIEKQIQPPTSRRLRGQQSWQRMGCALSSPAGFTLIELIMVVAILGIIAALVIPAYRTFVVRAKYARTMQELRLIEIEISDYYLQNGTLPANLAAIQRDTLTDPWENLYVYSAVPARRFGLDPLNNDFDLFSKGPDGVSADLVHVLGVGGPGSDDMIRGRQGGFLGTGAEWAGDD